MLELSPERGAQQWDEGTEEAAGGRGPGSGEGEGPDGLVQPGAAAAGWDWG